MAFSCVLQQLQTRILTQFAAGQNCLKAMLELAAFYATV